MKSRKRLTTAVIGFLLTALLCGCQSRLSDTKLVLYTGFKENEVFRIETISCMLPEVLVYLTNTQNQYESVFGEEIWDTELNGVTFEENVKETVLANLAQIKTMNLLAGKHGVTLDSGELETVEEAAAVYYGSLNEAERQAMLVDQETIEGLYAEFALANKVYEYIIKDIVTDDEELNAFLFSLGCYSGEPVTVISHSRSSCVISVKDARYNIDNDLARAISV